MSQRGFSLLEAIIVAAIVATIAAFFFGSAGSKPGAAHSAIEQFDAALAYARAVASASGSATMAFAPQNGATAITVAGVPPFTIYATVRDKTLGPPPFAIVLDAAGHASGAGCPAAGWDLTFRAGTKAEVRALPCRP